MPDASGFRAIPKPSQSTRHTHAERALPPAGHARNETLKQRTDELAEKLEKRAAAVEATSIDPKALEPDREILSQFDGTNVSNEEPGYRYCWVNYDTPSSARGIMVKSKLAEQDKQGRRYGWEVVQGEMRESMENKDAAGYRRIGDTILMRIKEEGYQRILRDTEQRLVNQLGASHSQLKELGDKYRNKGIIVHADNVDSRLLNTMENRARGVMAAEQKFDDALRTGTVAGV